ncbi:hypothetical protein D3C75_1229170 [compost metagenome]
MHFPEEGNDRIGGFLRQASRLQALAIGDAECIQAVVALREADAKLALQNGGKLAGEGYRDGMVLL